jgi:tryptophanyl-tRNA synthetase
MTQQSEGYHGPMRVFSGVQPTGDLHLGNYLGALKKFVDLQHQYECLFCVVDLHAITVAHDPASLGDDTRAIAAAFLGAGLDPQQAIIYPQSAVTAHAELGWIFNCVARMGWLERMTQFKEKAGADKERASVGLFAYPVLQAADILAFKATHVPVGEDQKQHLELSRDIADRFNREYNSPDFFPLPEPLIKGPGARVMSLKDGTKKMSKSDPSDLSRVNLSDDADMIAKKIKKAKSDADLLPETLLELEGRPEARNLVSLYAALKGVSDEAALSEFTGKGFGALKPALADIAVEVIAPIGTEMKRWLDDRATLDAVLAEGSARADSIAAPIIAEVRDLVGFWKSAGSANP